MWFNSSIALLCGAFYFILIFKCLSKSFKIERLRLNKEMSEKEKENYSDVHGLGSWQFLKMALKEERTLIGGVLHEVVFAKEFLVGAFIIFFVENPYVQLLPSIAIFSITLFLLLKHRPFKEKLHFTAMIINEGTYLLILLIFLIYHVTEDSLN
jgi:hypothetical protein